MAERQYLKKSPKFPRTKESDKTLNWKGSLNAKHNKFLKRNSHILMRLKNIKDRGKIAKKERRK